MLKIVQCLIPFALSIFFGYWMVLKKTSHWLWISLLTGCGYPKLQKSTVFFRSASEGKHVHKYFIAFSSLLVRGGERLEIAESFHFVHSRWMLDGCRHCPTTTAWANRIPSKVVAFFFVVAVLPCSAKTLSSPESRSKDDGRFSLLMGIQFVGRDDGCVRVCSKASTLLDDSLAETIGPNVWYWEESRNKKKMLGKRVLRTPPGVIKSVENGTTRCFELNLRYLQAV